MAPVVKQTLRQQRLRVALVSLGLAACVSGGLPGEASSTTQPGFRFTLQVSITDAAIRLVPHKSATGQLLHTYIQQGGLVARFPRGTLVEFVFTNHGSKTYLPAIRVSDASQSSPLTPTKPLYTASHAIGPGHQVSLFGNFYFRGSFQIERLLGKKPQGQPIRLSIY